MEFWFSNYLTFYRKSLFLVLFAAVTIVIFISCEKNNEFGLEINPDSNTLAAFYCDTIDLNTIKNLELKLEENKEYGYLIDEEETTLSHGLERFLGILPYYLGYKYFGI